MKVNASEFRRLAGGIEKKEKSEIRDKAARIAGNDGGDVRARALAKSSSVIDPGKAETLLEKIKNGISKLGPDVGRLIGDIDRANAFALLKE